MDYGVRTESNNEVYIMMESRGDMSLRPMQSIYVRGAIEEVEIQIHIINGTKSSCYNNEYLSRMTWSGLIQ